MKLVIVRHAIAADKKRFRETGKPDSARPLTGEGKKLFRAQLRGIREATGALDRIVTSPYLRAHETAGILKRAYPGVKLESLDLLEPDRDPRLVLNWLRRQERAGKLALVGHEPDLSKLIAYLCWGRKDPERVRLKKGALCILEFASTIMAGEAEITCLMQPQTLRA